MRRLHLSALVPAVLIITACSGNDEAVVPEPNVGLIGDWQSLEDTNYVLKLNAETYREFYDTEEMSRDQWQPVKSCDDPQPVEKTTASYGGFQIWTRETDDRICYAISDWTVDEVSFTYAGTTSRYARTN